MASKRKRKLAQKSSRQFEEKMQARRASANDEGVFELEYSGQ